MGQRPMATTARPHRQFFQQAFLGGGFCGFVLQGLGDGVEDGFEGGLVGDGEIGEDLAVEGDAGGGEAFHKSAVGEAVARGRRR